MFELSQLERIILVCTLLCALGAFMIFMKNIPGVEELEEDE